MSRWTSIRRRGAPVLLCFLLVVCLLYQGYRYPFQINSSVTSPTYSDTPTWLQLGKWGLIAVAAAGLAILLGVRGALVGASRWRLVAVVLEVAILVLALVRIALGGAAVDAWVLSIGAATAVLVTLAVDASGAASTWISRIIVAYSFIVVAAEVAQITLFLTIGRLPALAYANSPSIRFGSLLDDPNGFAVLLAALIPTTWITLGSRPNVRLGITIALLCCLPLTQSWTGVTATVVALSLTYLLTRGLVRDLRRAAAVVVSMAVVVGVAAFFARSTIAELILLKRGSAEDHAKSFTGITPDPPAGAQASSSPASASAPSAATIEHASQASQATWTSGIESSYVNILVNYGPLLLAAYLALGVIAIVLLLRGRTRLPLALRAGSASYLLCFLLASANLGLDRTFPCNVLYFFFCGLSFASSTARRDRTTDRRRRLRPTRGGDDRPPLPSVAQTASPPKPGALSELS